MEEMGVLWFVCSVFLVSKVVALCVGMKMGTFGYRLWMGSDSNLV